MKNTALFVAAIALCSSASAQSAKNIVKPPALLAARSPSSPAPGPVKMSFKEWTVPTIGSRPHYPLGTPPNKDARPRRRANAANDIIYCADYARDGGNIVSLVTISK